jgi:hypothetical protein
MRDLQRVEAILEDILPANAPHRADTASTKGDFQGVAQSASALKAGSDLAPDEIDRLLRG